MIDLSAVPVFVDGTELKGSELPLDAQEMLLHILDLREQQDALKFKLRQLEVAEAGFAGGMEQIIRTSKKEAVNG